FNRRTFWPDMGKIMTHTATPLHQLNLLLIYFHNPSIGVRRPVSSDYKTVRQRSDLRGVTDPRHGATLGNDVLKILYQVKNLLLSQWVRIFLFNSGNFPRNPPVHIIRRLFEQRSIRVFQGILVDPYAGSK